MAKKKRKHTGGKPAAYAQYQFQGPKLTKAQKVYNEEIRKAYRRVKSWEKKYGVKLDLIPKPPKRATKQAIERIRDITYQKLKGAIIEGAELEAFISRFIRELADVDNHISYPGWQSNWQKWQKRERALRYRDKMVDAVNKYRSEKGSKVLYQRLKMGEVAQELLRTARELYELDSDNAEETAAQGLFNTFVAILSGEILSDQELRGEAEYRGDNESFVGSENYG